MGLLGTWITWNWYFGLLPVLPRPHLCLFELFWPCVYTKRPKTLSVFLEKALKKARMRFSFSMPEPFGYCQKNVRACNLLVNYTQCITWLIYCRQKHYFFLDHVPICWPKVNFSFKYQLIDHQSFSRTLPARSLTHICQLKYVFICS